jgi:hypothetical protein
MICNICTVTETLFCILSAHNSEKTTNRSLSNVNIAERRGRLCVDLDEKAVNDGGRLHAGPVLLLLPLLALGHGGVAGH